ncbi:MAG: hypothetical protein Kow0075_13450 [Salibacteraceae bacterium]
MSQQYAHFVLKKNSLAPHKLKHKRDFDEIFRSGTRVLKHPLLAIYTVRPTGIEPHLLAAFSAPKKHHGVAVNRNRVKRLLREAFRNEHTSLEATAKKHGICVKLLFIALNSDNISYETVRQKMVLLLREIATDIETRS